MTDTCKRDIEEAGGLCQLCGAMPDEGCPLADLSPWVQHPSRAITAGRSASCDPDDGVCESCQ